MGRDVDKLSEPAAKSDAISDAAGEMESEVEASKDARLEERFIWVIVTVILIDALIFSHMENWTGPIVIGLFELVLVLVLARKYQIEEIPQIVAKFLDRAADHTKKD